MVKPSPIAGSTKLSCRARCDRTTSSASLIQSTGPRSRKGCHVRPMRRRRSGGRPSTAESRPGTANRQSGSPGGNAQGYPGTDAGDPSGLPLRVWRHAQRARHPASSPGHDARYHAALKRAEKEAAK